MKKGSLCLGLIAIMTTSLSAERILSFKNLRSLSMGGVSVATSFDDQALVSNPAALSLAESKFKAFRIRAALNADELSSYSNVYNAVTDTSSSEQDRLIDISRNVPFDFSSEIAATPLISYTSPGFAAGVFTNTAVDGGMLNKINTRIDVELTSDIAGIVGMSRDFEIAGHDFYLGAAVKYVNRGVYYNSLTGEERINIGVDRLLQIVDNGENLPDEYELVSAGGVGVDVGLLYPLEMEGGKANIGFSVQNLIGELSGTRTESGRAQNFTRTLPTTATVGFGYEHEKVFFFDKVTYGIDYRIVSPETTFFKDVFMGVEGTTLNNFLRLRAGLNQGYIVGGVGIDTAWVSVDFAHYTLERGVELGDNKLSMYALEFRLFF